MKNNFSRINYHFARLMTRIDERKLIENITVDQTHDFTTCRLAV